MVLKMDDPDLGGSIRAGPDLCDQRIPCPNIGGWLTRSPGYWWPAEVYAVHVPVVVEL